MTRKKLIVQLNNEGEKLQAEITSFTIVTAPFVANEFEPADEPEPIGEVGGTMLLRKIRIRSDEEDRLIEINRRLRGLPPRETRRTMRVLRPSSTSS